MVTDIAGLLLTCSVVLALIGPRLTGLVVRGKPLPRTFPVMVGFYLVVAIGAWLSFEIYQIA